MIIIIIIDKFQMSTPPLLYRLQCAKALPQDRFNLAQIFVVVVIESAGACVIGAGS